MTLPGYVSLMNCMTVLNCSSCFTQLAKKSMLHPSCASCRPLPLRMVSMYSVLPRASRAPLMSLCFSPFLGSYLFTAPVMSPTRVEISSSSADFTTHSSSYPRPNLLFKCWALPRHLNLPPTIIQILWHKASHSSMLWVVRMTLVSPWQQMSLMTLHMNLRATGSIPVLGSSKNMMLGCPIIAHATLSFLLFPPEYPPASL
mmetsp:Transcript_19596/g.40921  ORF Transcript_19596/g.40921 Transcript_19596/m.40921 type:complete len:201 (-) Transcript_19596:4972-5574(-)